MIFSYNFSTVKKTLENQSFIKRKITKTLFPTSCPFQKKVLLTNSLFKEGRHQMVASWTKPQWVQFKIIRFFQQSLIYNQLCWYVFWERKVDIEGWHPITKKVLCTNREIYFISTVQLIVLLGWVKAVNSQKSSLCV